MHVQRLILVYCSFYKEDNTVSFINLFSLVTLSIRIKVATRNKISERLTNVYNFSQC